ncbi:MAG: MBL fold metallo-hydrolase [Verrucomicrobiota bacterium]
MEIPIEDFSEDIIGKAMRGLGVDAKALIGRSGVSEQQLQALLDGQLDEDAILKVAPALELHPGALLASAKKQWRPKPVNVPGLAAFNTPYHDMYVNAYLAWDENSRKAVAFDTGADLTEMLRTLHEQNLHLEAILLTHTHPDHVLELEKLRLTTGNPPVFVHRLEEFTGADSFVEKHEWNFGTLHISALHTSGHSPGGTTYLVDGLTLPVAVVGDAMFAGSMGGGMHSYPDAVRNNREKLLTLPDNTVLCPGHGPLTTVGEEKLHNPFFPEFKHSA